MKTAIIGFKDAECLRKGVVTEFCAQVEIDDSFDWNTPIDGKVLDIALSQLFDADPDFYERIEDVVLLDIIYI